MIYTITFNPSLDYVIQVDHFKPGIINKTKLEEILPGGKALMFQLSYPILDTKVQP